MTDLKAFASDCMSQLSERYEKTQKEYDKKPKDTFVSGNSLAHWEVHDMIQTRIGFYLELFLFDCISDIFERCEDSEVEDKKDPEDLFSSGHLAAYREVHEIIQSCAKKHNIDLNELLNDT